MRVLRPSLLRPVCLLLAGLFCIEPALADPLAALDANGTLTDRADYRIGQQVMQQMRADPSFVADPEITDYLNGIARRLISQSQSPWQPIHVFFLNDPDINAFALPGGFIGVNSSLLLATGSESELASVLGHEIGHVVQHHFDRSQQEAGNPLITSLAAIALIIAAAKSNNPDAANAAVTGMSAGMIQNDLSNSREHEEEADRIGFQLLKGAGFDPRAMAAFFRKLQQFTNLNDTGAEPAFLRDHPLTADRIAEAEDRAARLPYRQYASSMEYYLVKAKARALLMPVQDALQYFRNATGARSYGVAAAQHYGLAYALMRAARYDDARRQLALARADLSHPMLDSLAAEIDLEAGRPRDAVADCRSAQSRWQNNGTLGLECLRIDIQAHDSKDALQLADARLRADPDDARLYALKAEAENLAGHATASHMAQAEACARRGELRAAIEQLGIARQSTSDFYTLSIIDARLKDLRQQADAVKALDKNNQ